MNLALVATHPIQYQVPWYRGLAARDDIDLTVLFGMIPDEEQQGVGFGIPFQWDLPLLEGYDWELLENARPAPGLGGFRASSTPHVGRTLQRLDPDAVIITGWHQLPMVQALRAALRLGIPRIVRGESNALRARPWYVRLLHRTLLSRYDAFLAIGSANRAFYRGYGIPEERIFDGPYFVENDRFAEQAAAEEPRRSELRDRWGIPPDATCYLFCGKLEAKKRPGDLLDAVARLAADPEAPAVHALVVGTGPLMEDLRRRAEAEDLPVTFAGFLNQTEISAAYVASDCLVLPSDTGETWGLVVNEAMASGRPAVVSDQVGCAEDLVEPGVTGDVFPCGDVPALAGTLGRLATDRDELGAMGAHACERVADFSADAVVEGTVAAARYVARDSARAPARP